MSGESMVFPENWEQFLRDYEFEDARRIYTNGSRLIPSFRVRQMMEHYAPAEAARLMGYEVVEDSATGEVPGGKPRICKVLGVEVGERATYTDPQHGEIEFEISSDGNISFVFKDGTQAGQIGIGYATVRLINHPDRIIRKPRFTGEEVAAAKMLLSAGAVKVYRDARGVLRWGSGEYVNSLRNALPHKLFPSLNPGQSVALEDIIRAD